MTFDLAAAVHAAPAGAVIRVPGSPVPYPFLELNKKLTLLAGAANPATLAGIRVDEGGSGSSITGFSFAPTPDAHSNSASSAIFVLGAHDVTFQQCRAQYGVWNGALTGRAATIQDSQRVTLSGCDFSLAFKGVDFANSTDCILAGSSIHDVATSPIVGSMCDRLKVLQNHLRASNPAPPDHADMIHFYTAAGQSGPTDGITIQGNLIEMVPGANLGAVLGVNFEDQFSKWYTGVDVSFNTINVSNTQGIIVEGVRSGRYHGNVLHPCKGADPQHQVPTIIVRPALIPLLPTLSIDISSNTCAPDVLHVLQTHFPNNIWLSKAEIAALIAPGA